MEHKANYEINDGRVIFSIKSGLYSLDIIQAAAYAFMDRAHALLDGDPQGMILVLLIPKVSDEDLDKLALEFNDELNNYAFFIRQSQRNKEIKEAIIKTALFSITDKDQLKNVGK